MLKNTKNTYGWVSIFLHWIAALLVIVLFALGLYIEGLDYYDANYRVIPLWHKSLGFIFFILVIFRLLWRLINPVPIMENTTSKFEHIAAMGGQYIFYILMLIIPLSGYAIATAEGDAFWVFDWFVIPSIIQFDNSSDIVSNIHEKLAWLLMMLVFVHVTATMRHHFINKDNTLLKILGLLKEENIND